MALRKLSIRKLLRQRWQNTSSGFRKVVTISGGAVFTTAVFQHKFSECVEIVGNTSEVLSPHWLFWLRLRYGRTRSRWMGEMAEWTLPVAMRPSIFQLFAWYSGADLSEVRYPLDSFRTFNDFFSRKLGDGLRPIDDVPTGLVSPVDGQLLSAGVIDGQGARIDQIKGATFSVPAFLGLDPIAQGIAGDRVLRYAVLHMEAGNYHRFHAPCNLKFSQGRHFAGEFLPVRPSMVGWMDDIYAVNERVVLTGSWQYGQMHLTAVAAACVGNIFLEFDPKLKTNRWRDIVVHCGGDVSSKFYPKGVELEVGETMGGFKMGSTVVLVFEAPRDFDFDVNIGDCVRVGQRLGDVRKMTA